MFKKISVTTSRRTELVDITTKVSETISEAGVQNGICVVYVPHTTAAVTINENADPSVKADIIEALSHLVPPSADYSHMEGNADAHIKSTLVGCSERILVEDGKPVLGTWQGIFFCEFDGPRNRKAYIKITED